MNIEKSCGAVVYRKCGADIEFIAVKSRESGHWGFPKGHMESGETEIETTKREIFEETGLEVTLLDEFRTEIEYYLSENINKRVIYFIGKTENQCVNIQQEEIADYKWLNYSDMLNILTFENAKDVLKKAKDFIDDSID
ncbi:bis(5'-nucleosyl)-tetraphosphatase [Haloimpatiens sp. FM7330]|uniref:bis(5'-nucleosyl)-tetraphosphatase n=1 Tax=Haloimpatiens sp. FM7330 TaxID=3298610 RepID=UPI003644BAA0